MKVQSKKSILLKTILATSILALSACGAAEKTSKSQGDEKKYHLSVGYLKANGAPLADIAIEEGYFKKENLEVELIPFNASTDGINALQSNKIDIGLTFGTSTPLAFISQGADLDIIGGYMEGGHPIYVPAKDKNQYKSFKDYKGKTIGTVRLSVPDIVYRSALKKAGLDLEKDVKIVEFKTMANLIEAAGSGKVDVAFSSTGFLSKAEALGLAPVAWSNDVQPGHVCCRVVSRSNLSEEDAAAYKKFVKGIIQAERVKNENPKKAVEVSKDRLKVDDKTINEIVNEKHLVNSADPNTKQVEKMWEQMKDLGYVNDDKGIDLNEHFNLTFYQEALEELIKENPNDSYYKKIQKRFDNQNL